MDWKLRLAKESDVPSLEKLIPLSVRTLQAPYYSAAQMEAALGPVFGVDRQLIRDGTFFVAEQSGQIIGCGGWSKRRASFGGDQHQSAADSGQLDPKEDAARIRAFFVHPDWARRGIGRSILACLRSRRSRRRFYPDRTRRHAGGRAVVRRFWLFGDRTI